MLGGNKTGKNWEELSDQEQQEKLVAINELLKAHGLDKVKATILQQIVLPLKAGIVQRQIALMIEGKAKSTQGADVKAFTKAAKTTILEGINPKTAGIEIEAKLGAGDEYKRIEGLADIETLDEKSIDAKAGQVILIDFWATWCPPCQAPMAHNQHMLEAHGARWGDKVRIVGISIDQTAEAVVKHVKAKKWDKVEHFHRSGSSASEDYGVSGVPHVVLIDGNGKIAYAGHPASRDLEKDIETLIKGEPLKGVAAGGDDEEEDDVSEFKELDLSKVS